MRINEILRAEYSVNVSIQRKEIWPSRRRCHILVLQMLLLEKQDHPVDGARMCSLESSRKDKAQFAHQTTERQRFPVRLPVCDGGNV